MVVESHLVVVDVEKESMPSKQEKNGLTKDKYRTYSRTKKRNGNTSQTHNSRPPKQHP